MASWGAALIGAIINGELRDMLVLASWCKSIGLETEGGVMTKLVERNTTMPVERKQMFTPPQMNPATVSIRIYEGESTLAADNVLIGEFPCVRPENSPCDTCMEVTVDIDVSGCITVQAGSPGGSSVTYPLPHFERCPGDPCLPRCDSDVDEDDAE
jgi:molecular chaperone DnaK